MQDDYSSTGIAITIVTFFLQTIILPSAPFFLPDHGPRHSWIANQRYLCRMQCACFMLKITTSSRSNSCK